LSVTQPRYLKVLFVGEIEKDTSFFLGTANLP
jgi:hypothetical protein